MIKNNQVILSLFLALIFFNFASKPSFAAISFKGGFESFIYQYPNAVNNWHDPQPYPSGDRLVRVNSPVRKGDWALKAMVNPGDSYGSSGERAEVYGMYGPDGKQVFENEASGTQYFANSIYLPADFTAPYNSLHPGVDSVWAIFQQLHGADAYSSPPIFAIGATNDYYVQLWSGNLDFFTDPTKAYTKKYSLGPIQKSKWVDFVWKIKFAKDFTGSLDVWKRIEGEANFTKILTLTDIPTLQFKSSVQNGAILDAYWKTGYYTSQEIFTRVIFLDSHARGDSFNEVVSEAFPQTPSPSPSPKPGDANGDGKVDGIDYVVWLSHFNQNVSGATSGDFNNSGKVDGVDYVIWLNNYGK